MKNQHRIHKIVGLTNCGINVREAKSKGFRILGTNKQRTICIKMTTEEFMRLKTLTLLVL